MNSMYQLKSYLRKEIDKTYKQIVKLHVDSENWKVSMFRLKWLEHQLNLLNSI